MKKQIAALVVDDEAVVRFDLAQTLEEAGYTTFEAADAAEAVAVLEAHAEIRVVFTDIQMPGSMDGLALSHYVRKRWPPTIIVVSSGRRSPIDQDLPSGAHFVAKPYSQEALESLLQEIHRQLQ